MAKPILFMGILDFNFNLKKKSILKKKKIDFLLAYVAHGNLRVPSKNVSQFGPSVSPAKADIFI